MHVWKQSLIGIMLCLLAQLLSVPQVDANSEDALVMGVFPRRNAVSTARLFKPLATYLSHELGRSVRLVTTKNFADFWTGVRQQKYDLVHYNQYHYIKSDDLYDVIVCNEEFGRRMISGAIYVRQNSDIQRLSDLKGKKIVFGGGKKAMMSYIVPRYLLQEAGLGLADFTLDFANNPPNALISVFYQQADAAGAGDVVINLPVVRKTIDTSKVRYLARSEALFHLPWAVKRTLPVVLRQRIQSLLLNLDDQNRGREILKMAKLTRFNLAEDRDYDPHRDIIQVIEAADE